MCGSSKSFFVATAKNIQSTGKGQVDKIRRALGAITLPSDHIADPINFPSLVTGIYISRHRVPGFVFLSYMGKFLPRECPFQFNCSYLSDFMPSYEQE